MKRRLFIQCPQCASSTYFKEELCNYCNGSKRVDILQHHAIVGITDERNTNVKTFLADMRFVLDYLQSKNR